MPANQADGASPPTAPRKLVSLRTNGRFLTNLLWGHSGYEGGI